MSDDKEEITTHSIKTLDEARTLLIALDQGHLPLAFETIKVDILPVLKNGDFYGAQATSA
jgi:hypothetical protein